MGKNRPAKSSKTICACLTTKWRDEFPCIFFSSIPRKLGRVHLQIFFCFHFDLSHRSLKNWELRQGWKIEPSSCSRILAVVVDVAVFLPWLQIHGSAPPHLFSTASRCFCVCKRRFSDVPGRWVTCIAACVDLPCGRRA